MTTEYKPDPALVGDLIDMARSRSIDEIDAMSALWAGMAEQTVRLFGEREAARLIFGLGSEALIMVPAGSVQ